MADEIRSYNEQVQVETADPPRILTANVQVQVETQFHRLYFFSGGVQVEYVPVANSLLGSHLGVQVEYIQGAALNVFQVEGQVEHREADEFNLYQVLGQVEHGEVSEFNLYQVFAQVEHDQNPIKRVFPPYPGPRQLQTQLWRRKFPI